MINYAISVNVRNFYWDSVNLKDPPGVLCALESHPFEPISGGSVKGKKR
jgi:hypothetical protein